MTESHSPSSAQDTPKPSAAEIRALLTAEVARASRPWHFALLLGAMTATALIIALLVTEPALPPRARIAFAIMIAVMIWIGASWGAFAALVLARRGILFGKKTVVGARLAVTFTTVFALGAWAVGRWSLTGRPWVAMAAGVAVMAVAAVAVAAVLMLRARRRFAELARRRAVLERTLAG